MSEHKPTPLREGDLELFLERIPFSYVGVLALVAEVRECRQLLRSLRNEAHAIVSREREAIIEAVSVTNVRCLENRIDEATAYLAACESKEESAS